SAFFFQAEDGIRDFHVTGVQTCALPILATIAASPVEAGAASATWLAVRDLESGSLRPQIVATHNMDPVRVTELVDVQAFFDEVRSEERRVGEEGGNRGRRARWASRGREG